MLCRCSMAFHDPPLAVRCNPGGQRAASSSLPIRSIVNDYDEAIPLDPRRSAIHAHRGHDAHARQKRWVVVLLVAGGGTAILLAKAITLEQRAMGVG